MEETISVPTVRDAMETVSAVKMVKRKLKKADGQIAGTVAQSPVNIGKKAVDIALDILEGKDFEKETSVDVFMINKENVEMYGADGWQ